MEHKIQKTIRARAEASLLSYAELLGFSDKKQLISFINRPYDKNLEYLQEKIDTSLQLNPPSIELHNANDSSVEILGLPLQIKCMVSGKPIGSKSISLVACPFCGNIADENYLKNWLEVRALCPICKNNWFFLLA